MDGTGNDFTRINDSFYGSRYSSTCELADDSEALDGCNLWHPCCPMLDWFACDVDGKKTARAKSGKEYFGILFVAIVVLLVVAWLVLPRLRPDHMSSSYGSMNHAAFSAMEFRTFQISYGDNYYLSLYISAEETVSFTIYDENDEIVYRIETDGCDKENVKLRMSPGEYTVRLADFEGGRLQIEYSIQKNF